MGLFTAQGLFDTRAAEERMSQFIAPGPPTGFGENAAAAFRSNQLSETTIGSRLALIDTYDKYIEQIRDETGQTLDNPVFTQVEFGLEDVEAVTPTLEERTASFSEQVVKLGLTPRTPDNLQEEAFADIRAAVEENEEIAARGGFPALLGQFTGGAAAILLDPPVLASMAVGAPISAGILRTALIEGAIASGVETVIQPTIQAARAKAGLPAGTAQALRNIGLAGLGGVVFGGGIKSLAVGGRALFDKVRTRDELHAARYLERHADLRDQNPFPERAAAEHVQRVSRAQSDLAEAGIRLADEQPDPVAPVRSRESDLDLKTAPGVRADLPASTNAFKVGREARKKAFDGIEAEEDRRVLTQLAQEIRDFPDLPAALQAVRTPPERPRAASLTQFLKELGGVKDPKGDLRSIGVTAKARPGFINNKSGVTLEEAAERATEEGFFGARDTRQVDPSDPDFRPSDQRVSTNDLLGAIDEDFNRGRPVFREVDQPDQADFDLIMKGLEALRRGLDDLGLDVDELSDEAIVAGLDGIARAFNDTPVTALPRQVARDLDPVEAQQDVLDEALEADIRRDLQEELAGEGVFDLDEEFFFGDEALETKTVRQVFDEIEADESLAKAWDDCFKGST